MGLVLLAPLGCERPAPSAPVQVFDHSGTPQGDLKNVMLRLESALAEAKTNGVAGVSSSRKCSYELFEPAKDGDPYTAEVTIRTSVRVSPKPAKPGDAPPAGVAAGGAEPEPITTNESKVYKLAYKDDRWDMVDPPQDKLDETEKICFQFALNEG